MDPKDEDTVTGTLIELGGCIIGRNEEECKLKKF